MPKPWQPQQDGSAEFLDARQGVSEAGLKLLSLVKKRGEKAAVVCCNRQTEIHLVRYLPFCPINANTY